MVLQTVKQEGFSTVFHFPHVKFDSFDKIRDNHEEIIAGLSALFISSAAKRSIP